MTTLHLTLRRSMNQKYSRNRSLVDFMNSKLSGERQGFFKKNASKPKHTHLPRDLFFYFKNIAVLIYNWNTVRVNSP